jgi:hypothetical protein
VIIEFDIPSKKLSPNKKNGKSYHAYRETKDIAQALARSITLSVMARQGRPELIPKTLRITFIHPTRHNRDLDNSLASCKAHIDGMCQALGIDDGCFTAMIITKEYQKGVSKMVFDI